MPKIKFQTNKVKLFIVILVVSILVISIVNDKRQVSTNKTDYMALRETLLMQDASIPILIDKYEKLFKNNEEFSYAERAIISKDLSTLYVLDHNYKKGIEESTLALYYALESDNNQVLIWNLIDNADTCVKLSAYKIAETLIDYVFYLLKTAEIHNPISVYEYACSTLIKAQIGLGKLDEAIAYLEQMPKYIQRNDEFETVVAEYKLMASRIFQLQNEFEKSRVLLLDIDAWGIKNGDYDTHRITMPYLELLTRQYLHDKEYTKARHTAIDYLSLCDTERKDEKVYQFNNLYEMSKQFGLDFPIEVKNYLLVIYSEVVKEKSENIVYYMMTNLQKGMDVLISEKKMQQECTKDIIENILVLNIIGSLIFFLKNLHTKNKYDGLTGLLSRKQFETDYKKYQKYKEYGIIMCEIDFFKKCNDTFGHEFGDTVLMGVGEKLRKVANKKNKVYRYGGEEFCILSSLKDKTQLLEAAEQFRKEIENLEWREDIKITISLGVAWSTEDGNVFSNADERLYDSKKKGRNCVT